MDFETIVKDAANRYRSPEPKEKESPRPPGTLLSLGPMSGTTAVSVEVDVARLADFLRDVGEALLSAQVPDPQVWLQKRSKKGAKETTEIHGILVDVDKVVDDVLEAIEEAGVPLPNCHWRTRHGFKLAYAFDRAVSEEEFRRIADWLVIAFDGGDPASANPGQGQHLPIALKDTGSGPVKVRFEPAQANAAPYRVEDFALDRLPRRLARIFGGRAALTDAERALVVSYLDSSGLSPPQEPGDKRLYAACPECEVHDTPKCYVNRRQDGTLFVHCRGNHDGRGPQSWDEHDLLRRLQGGDPGTAGIDPVADLPATWAGRAYRRHHLEKALAGDRDSAQLIDVAERVWSEAWAHQELAGVYRDALFKAANILGADPDTVPRPELDDVRDVAKLRQQRCLDVEPIRMTYDALAKDLYIRQSGSHDIRVLTKSDTLSSKTHNNEWRGTNAFRLTADIKVHVLKKIATTIAAYKRDNDDRYVSHFNKALVGHDSSLAALGVPRITSHVFPISFVDPGWEIDPRSKVLTATELVCTLRDAAGFDAVAFFLELFHAGKLPLASEQDVLRLIMAVASPLLRGIAAGLLGVYWFMGPPGSGKDFLADVVLAIWAAAIDYFHPEAGFDLSMTDDLEMKRSFYAAHPTVYARAKEAGKRKNMVERLIQFAGTRAVPARGMFKNEILIANDFTFVADSAEDLPERKEISRRTVVINVSEMDDAISKGAVLREITDHAADILADLKRKIESQPKEWYLEQTITKSRPIIPVALAKLFGATLDEVEGRDLGDVFAALHHYVYEDCFVDRHGVRSPVSISEGERQLALSQEPEKVEERGNRDGKEARLLANYSYSHFADALSRNDKLGFKALIREFSTPRAFYNALLRETDYQRVDRKELPYLPVQIGAESYAFKLVKGRRNFVLLPELEFCQKMPVTPIAADIRKTIRGVPVSPEPPKAPQEKLKPIVRAKVDYNEMDDCDPCEAERCLQ